MHLFYADALLRAPDNVAVASHIQRNGFWFPEERHFDDEVTEAVLQGLFEPICRDYQRVAHAVEAVPADSAFTAHELVHRLPGAFLRDVEDTLDDLTERGVLAHEREAYRWANGPSDLSAYRNDCVWHAAAHSDRMIS